MNSRNSNDECSKSTIATQRNPTTETRSNDGTPSRKSNRKRTKPFFSCSNSCHNEIHESEKHTTTTSTGDTTLPPLTRTSPLIEEWLVRDEQTNELYLPISSTTVLERKKEMLYVPLDSKNNLTLDVLADSKT